MNYTTITYVISLYCISFYKKFLVYFSHYTQISHIYIHTHTNFLKVVMSFIFFFFPFKDREREKGFRFTYFSESSVVLKRL